MGFLKGTVHTILLFLVVIGVLASVTVIASDKIDTGRPFDYINSLWSTPCNDINCPPTPTPEGTPSAEPGKNSILWQTPQVSLSAKDFYIKIGDKKFLDNAPTVQINSSPGSDSYTTLEATWLENGVEMRLNMYFEVKRNRWNVTEVRTYDGNTPGNWIYYKGFHGRRLGQTLKDGTLKLKSKDGQGVKAELFFKNLKLQPFLNGNGQTQSDD